VSYPKKRVEQYFVRAFLASLLLLLGNAAYGQNTISTVAGSAPPNNISPTAAAIEGPVGVVRNASGTLFVLTDSGVIYKVTPGTTAPSTLVIYAGTNTAGKATSGIPATSALTNEPDGGALDANGNFYFSDGGNCVIREVVAATGIINTVVGTGQCGFSGDGGPATSATLNGPQGIAFDGAGNLFIADINNNVIRRVDAATKIITTYAGTGAQGFTGDGGPATSATLGFPQALATDANGNLFIADTNNNVIRHVAVGTQIITTVVGTGVFGFSGDGGPATQATMQAPGGLLVDAAENIYIADTENAVVRKVTAATGIITTIVGNRGFGFGGDGGPAVSAMLTNPLGIALDPTTGNLWISDFWNNRIRLYSASNQQISTVVGSGLVGDGAVATSASLYDPRSPTLDSQGNLYIVDAQNNRIRLVDATTKVISTLAGNGIVCPQPQETCGDGGSATAASLNIPRTVTIEPSGNLLIGDGGDNRVREVAGGKITTIAGSTVANTSNQCTNPFSQCGDGGPATSALLFDPRATVLDSHGNIFFVDSQDNRIRRIDATTKIITTIAGNGPDGNAGVGCPAGAFSGDGGPAVNANLSCPLGLDIDSSDNLFVSDTFNNRIRRIDAATQIITTVAGNGTQGFSGDAGLAASAGLNQPNRVSVNAAGNFFISDSGNNRIRRVDGTTGIIATFTGNGNFGFGGDGGPALLASLATPTGVVVDNQGNMYIGDLFNNRIRLVLLNPNVTVSTTTAPFANQPINTTATLPVTVKSSGDAPLTISSIALAGASVFSLATSANPCPVAPATLAVGAQCVIDVAFTPTQFVASTGTITITDNGPTANNTQIINVTGTGAAALTVAATGSGTGTVTSTPAGISCPTTCTATFTGNSHVTLTAVPGANSTFGAFSTNCVPNNTVSSCTVTMSAAETVTATFTLTGGGGGGLTIAPSTLPNGAVGAAYGQTLIANGGTAPHHFAISSGALPAGLTLGATTGTIGGVLTGPAGPSTFTVTATDSSATPLTVSANFTITIAAADNSNNSELNGHYAFVYQGFNDTDGTMVVVAASFLADGHGNISSGFEDEDGSGGAQPTQEFTGSYTIGADNRGTMTLTDQSGGTGAHFAFAVGDIQAGVATKARFIRFDDVSGTNGQTGSGVILKQDPSIFALGAIKGAYAFGETGSKLTNGNPESGVGFLNADGNGNFTPAGLVDLNDGGGTGPSKPLSGTYQLTDETVSNGRLSASVTLTGVTGSVTDVVYIVSQSQFIFISINSAKTLVYSGIAQLQVPPAGGFGLSSLEDNSVVAVQGKDANGLLVALIGSIAADGNGNFTLSYVQSTSETTGLSNTTVSASAGGTYVVGTNGRAQLTYTSGGFPPTIIYLDGVNQGFAANSDANASAGPLDPGILSYSNATLSASDKFFFGTINPTSIQSANSSGVFSFSATTVQGVSDSTFPGGILLGDGTGPSQTYSVGLNGQLNVTGSGLVGFVANGCKVELMLGAPAKPGIATAECQQTPANGPILTVTEAGTGTGTVSSSPEGINCPTTCSTTFPGNSQVVLTAEPADGSTFTSFSENCTPATPQTNPPTCTVPIGTAAVAVTVTFGGSSTLPSLEITKTHTGNFTQGQQGATYSITVGNGAGAGPTTGAVTVTDTVPSGLTLVSLAGTGWTCTANSCTRSDALAGGANYPVITATVNVAANAISPQANQASVTGGGSVPPPAVFDPTIITPSAATLSLTVTEAGTGAGTVTSSPAGINCPTACSANFASGTAITLTATPNSNSTFAGWGGALCEGTSTCTFTITAAGTVTANFTAKTNTFALTVTEAGTGAGTVTSSPAGVNCPTACSANFASGSVVALTAAATEGSTFAGWSGAGCTGTGGCSVTVTAAEAVTATFNSGNSPVTISVAPGSPSSVNTTPGGSAVFGLALTSIPGTTGTVQLGCTSSSPNITCKIVPSSIILTGKPIDVAIVVETFCQGAVPGFGPLPGRLVGGLGLMLAAMAFCGVMWKFKQHPRWALSFAVLIFMTVGMSACASLPKSPGGAATPAGSYPLIVTATAPNGAISSVNLTLVVQ
jgi:trimeric autotransporter adhesin